MTQNLKNEFLNAATSTFGAPLVGEDEEGEEGVDMTEGVNRASAVSRSEPMPALPDGLKAAEGAEEAR